MMLNRSLGINMRKWLVLGHAVLSLLWCAVETADPPLAAQDVVVPAEATKQPLPDVSVVEGAKPADKSGNPAESPSDGARSLQPVAEAPIKVFVAPPLVEQTPTGNAVVETVKPLNGMTSVDIAATSNTNAGVANENPLQVTSRFLVNPVGPAPMLNARIAIDSKPLEFATPVNPATPTDAGLTNVDANLGNSQQINDAVTLQPAKDSSQEPAQLVDQHINDSVVVLIADRAQLTEVSGSSDILQNLPQAPPLAPLIFNTTPTPFTEMPAVGAVDKPNQMETPAEVEPQAEQAEQPAGT